MIEELVAATTRKAPFKSRGENLRRCHTSLPFLTSSWIPGTARGLTTSTCAPWMSNPAALSAAIFPDPTTRHLRPVSRTSIGKKFALRKRSWPQEFMVSQSPSVDLCALGHIVRGKQPRPKLKLQRKCCICSTKHRTTEGWTLEGQRPGRFTR